MFIKIFLKYYCVSVERRLFTVTRMNILNSISPGECRSIPAGECWVLGVICCWIVARLEHYQADVNLGHGTWGNEQSRAEGGTKQGAGHTTAQSPPAHLRRESGQYWGQLRNCKPCKTVQTAATVHWPRSRLHRTIALFRSRIWMILFRPFAEFALFWESCIILALRKHIFD